MPAKPYQVMLLSIYMFASMHRGLYALMLLCMCACIHVTMDACMPGPAACMVVCITACIDTCLVVDSSNVLIVEASATESIVVVSSSTVLIVDASATASIVVEASSTASNVVEASPPASIVEILSHWMWRQHHTPLILSNTYREWQTQASTLLVGCIRRISRTILV